MKAFKLLAVLLLTMLLAVSATAQINWMKQDNGTNYLTWYVPKNSSETSYIYENGKTRYVNNGEDASFATGYFTSTASSTVKLTVTLNSVSTGKIVSTIFSSDVDVSKTFAYKTFTITSKDYQNNAGQYIVVVKVKDTNTEYVDTSLFLQVFPNPTVAKIPPGIVLIKDTDPEMKTKSFSKDILETDNLQFTISANDKENDKLKYVAEECSAFWFGNCINWVTAQETDLSFNENTGAFTWTPGYEYVQHTVASLTRKAEFRFKAVEAKDDKKSTQWISAVINVHDVNRDPIFDHISDKTIFEGETVQFTIHATDADKDNLTYSISKKSPNSEWYTFNAQTQQFTFTPNFTQAGNYSVTFKVVDGFGGQDEETVKIMVLDKNQENKTQCNDGKDNDKDSKIDEKDPGCHTDGNADNNNTYNPDDNDETDEKPSKTPQCSDGLDNDKDGKTDEKDPGCHSDGDATNDKSYNPHDDDESDEPVKKPQCNDGIDNDKDGKKDKNDPGCHTDGDATNDQSYNDHDDDESDQPVNKPQCDDGIDNDKDGFVDMEDPGCANKDDNDESNYVPPQATPTQPIVINLVSAHMEDQIEAGKTLFVDTRIHNSGKKEAKDLKVQAKLYDLGVWGSTGTFTLKAGKETDKNVYVHLPSDAQAGWYLVKVTATNGYYHTSTYRLLYVDYYTFK